MDVRHLRYLLAVDAHGSFAAAARVLGISQQALSQSVASLEAEVGVKLFERGSGSGPTVFGRTLLKHAAVVDLEMRRALGALEQLREATAGEVRIGVGEGFPGLLAPLAISSMHARNPAIRIHIVEDYTKPLLDLLEAGQLDLVASAPAATPAPREEIAHELLGEIFDGVFVRSSHPLAHRKQLTVSDLQTYTWLFPSDRGEVHETVLETFVDEGVPPPSQFIWCDGTGTGIALLLANDYLILVSPEMVAPLMKAGLVEKLKVERPYRKRRLTLWTARNRTLSPVAVALMADLRVAVQEAIRPRMEPALPAGKTPRSATKGARIRG